MDRNLIMHLDDRQSKDKILFKKFNNLSLNDFLKPKDGL